MSIDLMRFILWKRKRLAPGLDPSTQTWPARAARCLPRIEPHVVVSDAT